jgi:glucosamine-6-phosphate deaminase
MGIGENGHIAFNDPPVADFSDPHTVKAVELDEACRIQQVNDGCFESFGNVPTHALTLTIPTLMSAGVLVCTVPGPAKAPAVGRMMGGPIETSCPATILRKHPQCYCYFDLDSAAEL